MKTSLTTKLIGVNFILAAFLTASILIAVYWVVGHHMELQVRNELNSHSGSVDSMLEGVNGLTRSAAGLIADGNDLVEGGQVDGKLIKGKLTGNLKSAHVDGLMLVDAKGELITSTGLSQDEEKALLKVTREGAGADSVRSGAVVVGTSDILMAAAVPVHKAGSVAGQLLAVVDLGKGHGFVDSVKKQKGVECTLFAGDARVSTTILKDGQRAIGTKMDTAEVLDQVLKNGQRLEKVVKILGSDYQTVYWPFLDFSGKPVGMLFLGQSRASIAAAYSQLMTSIIVAVAIAAMVILASTFLLAKRLTNQLGAMASNVSAHASSVKDAAQQLSQYSTSAAEGASEQAAAIEEISASLEELSSSVKRNAQSSETAKDLAQQARVVAENGEKEMAEMTRAVEEIKQAGNNTVRIIKTIDEIAFQTNILALNAAVEAARAGEAGLGFGVVAEEVRNLARRCAESAAETAQSINESTQKGDIGAAIAARVQTSFSQIVEKNREVAEVVNRIATSTGEQSQGLHQLNEATGQIDQGIQSNAASAQESASASQMLTGQAEQLNEVVRNMEQLITGREVDLNAGIEVDGLSENQRVTTQSIANRDKAAARVKKHPTA